MTDHEKRNLRKDALDRALQLNRAPSLEKHADAEKIVKDARLFEAYINEDRIGQTVGDIRG